MPEIPRKKSYPLKVLECLNTRMKLKLKEQQYYSYLKKGYEGELYFDELLSQYPSESLILKDLPLEVNNNYFQIDTLLIFSKRIIPLDIKNFEGDFYIKSENWYQSSGNEINNPYLQLKRSESLFRKVLWEIGYKTKIEPYLVFVHPAFTLYDTPLSAPFVFPTQLTRFLQNLQTTPSKISTAQRKLAQELRTRQAEKPFRTSLPSYDFSSLKKGVTCSNCNSFLQPVSSKKYICKLCGNIERTEQVIIHNIDQFELLFPDKKITANIIYEWCNNIISLRTIQRFLSQKYKPNGKGKAIYYTKQ